MRLKQALVFLGYSKPNLKPHIRPILASYDRDLKNEAFGLIRSLEANPKQAEVWEDLSDLMIDMNQDRYFQVILDRISKLRDGMGALSGRLAQAASGQAGLVAQDPESFFSYSPELEDAKPGYEMHRMGDGSYVILEEGLYGFPKVLDYPNRATAITAFRKMRPNTLFIPEDDWR